jgi:hypothetical protein
LRVRALYPRPEETGVYGAHAKNQNINAIKERILDSQDPLIKSQFKKIWYRPKFLMTYNEKEFFNRLIFALPDHYIFIQVALSATLKPNKPENDPSFNGIFVTFSKKIADYVICDKDLNVVAIVELDDITHEKKR